MNQVLRAVGFYYEAKNKGLPIIRSDIEREFGRKGWYATSKDRKLLNNAIAPQDIEEFYQIVFEQVNKWESISLIDYPR